MRKPAMIILVVMAVLAAAACQGSLTGPSASSRTSAGNVSTNPTTTLSKTVISVEDLVGTWHGTKVEGWNALSPNSKRELVAEGATVTLVLESGDPNNPPHAPRYTITVAYPGAKPGVDAGHWHYHEFWGKPQIDFYPDSLGPEPEWGELPAFLVALSDGTLTFWDGNGKLLPFDFGWGDNSASVYTMLRLVFTRY